MTSTLSSMAGRKAEAAGTRAIPRLRHGLLDGLHDLLRHARADLVHDELLGARVLLPVLHPCSMALGLLQGAVLFPDRLDAVASHRCLGVCVRHSATHLFATLRTISARRGRWTGTLVNT